MCVGGNSWVGDQLAAEHQESSSRPFFPIKGKNGLTMPSMPSEMRHDCSCATEVRRDSGSGQHPIAKPTAGSTPER